jgi:hydrogenase maturation protease
MVMLIFGCGNADRGDDAAGVLVARRLRASGVPAEEFTGDGIALVERWTGAEKVVLIDTVVTGRPAGTVSVWDEPGCPVQLEAFACSTHGIGVAHAIRLGRALGRMPRTLRIYGIEGACFGRGSQPSEEVLHAVLTVAEAVRLQATVPEWL